MAMWRIDTGDGNGGGTGNGSGAVTTSQARNIEYGRILMALGEGPGYTLVNGLKSVYLNETPIQNADGTFNFKGVSVAMTSGTNTQGVIPGFTSTESETSVATKVIAATPVTRTISTAGLNAVRVRISIPSLKKIDSQTGAESGVSVQVQIERQRAGYNGGVSEIVTLDQGGVISGKFGSKYVKGYRVELPNVGTGAWTIKMSRLTPDHTSGAPDYIQDETWWESYAELTDARLRSPNTAMLAVLVDGSQFPSVPKVAVDAYLRSVLVPSNYDPTTRTYNTTGFGTTGGIWDGTFGDRATSTLGKKVWTDNPAWHFYDLATDTRAGTGNYLDATKMDKWSLYAIAQVCDQLVPDGKGGTEPRFTCNLYLQAQEEAIKVLNHMASAFRGMVYAAGGLVTAVQDVDTTPVVLFTNANVEDGRFTYEGTARKARHNAALVSWIDPNQGYRGAVEYVEDAPSIARFGYNPVQIQGFGITSQGQARRLGLWNIITESLETDMIGFSTGMNGARLRPGDIIQVQDQFRAGLTRMGGRVVLGSTTTSILIDAPVTLAAGTYTLKCELPNGTLESRTITNVAGTTSTLTVGTPFSAVPEGIWLLQTGAVAALYRVIGIRESPDALKYEVSALLHNPTKYSLIESGLSISVSDTLPIVAFPPVTSLVGATSTRVANDKVLVVLTANWVPPVVAVGAANPKGYTCECSRDFNPWQPMNVTAQAAELVDAPPGSYRVRVVAKYPAGVSVPVQTTVSVGDSTGTDDYVVPDRKRQIKNEWNRIKAEQTTLDAQADTASVSRTAYDNAITALYTYLDGLTDIGGVAGGAWTGATSTGDWNNYNVTCYLGVGGGATMRSNWNTVYAARDALLASITSPLYGNDYLTGPQKLVVKADRDRYYNDFNTATTGLKARAIAAGVSWTAVDTAITALDTFLATLASWSNATKNWTDYNVQYLGGGGGATLRADFKAITDAWAVCEGSVSNTLATAATNALAAAPALITALPATCSAEYITLAVNRDFSGAVSWTGTGWTVSGGVYTHTAGANAATLPNTAMTAAPVNGEGYQISATITTTTAGTLTIGYGGGATSAIPISEGVIQDLIVGVSCIGAGTGLTFTPDAAWVGSIDNVSVKKTSSPGASYPTGKLVWLTGPWTDASGVVGPTGKVWPSTIYKSDLTGNVYRWLVATTMADQIVGKLIAGQISAGAIGANALAALLILTNDIRSFNYTAGTSAAAPVGYRLSGTTFTTTYLGGATDATCHMELGGSANFGGYKVATIADRAMNNTITFTSNGTWIAPIGVTKLRAILIGGGGGGYGATSTTLGGRGGGGGGTVFCEFDVTPGTTYTIIVGTGGAASANTSLNLPGGDGTKSAIQYPSGTDLNGISAPGGLSNQNSLSIPKTNLVGGAGTWMAGSAILYAAVGGNGGNNGLSGTASGAETFFNGGVGTTGNGGGGGGSTRGNGGDGATASANATIGSGYGGGGGGAGNTTTGFAPSAGATGLVILYW